MPNEPTNPFHAPSSRAAAGGLISVEQQRAVAEVQAMMIVARSMPRDPVRCLDLILQDCADPALAEEAEYEFSRGGSKISGPSIRLLETVARRWGNMEAGIKELSRQDGYSEMEAFAWDTETGFKDSKRFQVRHWRDTRSGGHQLTDERDIYEIGANMGARRKRACMEAVIPAHVIQKALDQCSATLAAKIDVNDGFIQNMLETFRPFGVTKEMIEKRIQRHISELTPGLAMQLKRVHNSLKSGMGQVSDFFEVASASGGAAETSKTGSAALKEAATKKKDEKAPLTDADVVASIKATCDKAIAIEDVAIALVMLDDARALARDLKPPHKQNAELAIVQAQEELDKRTKK